MRVKYPEEHNTFTHLGRREESVFYIEHNTFIHRGKRQTVGVLSTKNTTQHKSHIISSYIQSREYHMLVSLLLSL